VPRNSISRRVARAASIGGGRSYKQRTPLGWYSALLVICILGLALIVYSRHERQQEVTTTTTTTTTTSANETPPLESTHWQVALSVDVCGKVVNLPRSADQHAGIITTGDGVVDIKPARAGKNAAQYEGVKATLVRFLTSEGVHLADKSLELPHSLGSLAGTYRNGRMCGTKSGRVEVLIWSSPTASSSFAASQVTGIRYGNGEMYMVAFVPEGTLVSRPLGHDSVHAFIAPTTTTTTSTSTTTTTTAKQSATTTTTSS